VGGGAIAQPAVELRRLLELLAAHASHFDELAVPFGQAGHIAPEFFELSNWEYVLLAFAPSLLHVLERDLRRHARGEFAQSFIYFLLAGERGASESEHRKQLVDVNPVGGGVVIAEARFDLFVGQGEAFDEADTAVPRSLPSYRSA
jgi:hypothetical protein